MGRTIFGTLALLFLIAAGGSAMAVEQPAYTVELNAKPFQIRLYSPMIVASVHVSGNRSDAVGAGFRILADYIFGNNLTKGKIAMTAPVIQSASAKIAMTAPVSQSKDETGWDVRFIMPAGSTMESLPRPNNATVRLAETPPRRVAVITFSGFWSDANLHSHEAKLMDFVKQKGLTSLSAPIYAYYDPPWTPWFMRTNEIQIDVAP